MRGAAFDALSIGLDPGVELVNASTEIGHVLFLGHRIAHPKS
jgi:hypothetical protein